MPTLEPVYNIEDQTDVVSCKRIKNIDTVCSTCLQVTSETVVVKDSQTL